MKLSTLLGTVAVLTAFTLTLPSLAQGGPDFEDAEMTPPPPIDGEPLAMLPDLGGDMEMAAFPLSATASGGAGRMKFSEDQLEKIYSLKNKLADETGSTVAELGKQKRHLKDLLTQPSLDRAAVQSTQDKINKLQADLSNASLAFKMDLFEQFTPEQKQALRYKSMKRGHMGGFKHHGGPGGPMGSGGPGRSHRRPH